MSVQCIYTSTTSGNIYYVCYRWMTLYEESQPVLDRSQLAKGLATIRSCPSPQRRFCYSCSLLLQPGREGDADKKAHSGHAVKVGVSDQELREPTKLLNPVHDSKSQAVSHHIESP